MRRSESITKALEQLRGALAHYGSCEDKDIPFLGVTKGFELLTEYSWKAFKFEAESEGLEVISPKDAVRKAASLGLIDNPDLWLTCINIRNASVHDYFNISRDELVEFAENLCSQVEIYLNRKKPSED